jgi:pSer/pThr/pTyr-binding forkhead associated (FHA) protein
MRRFFSQAQRRAELGASRRAGSSSGRADPEGQALILVETGFYEGLEWPLQGDRCVVGRGREADLVLSEPTISRSHAAVKRGDGGWVVEDLNSTNGTVVNGTRTTRARIKNGDEIQLGRLVLRLRLNGEAGVA